MFFIISGLFVHLVFLASIFDIYFKSPVVNGITPQFISLKAPARRLVLIVADGLRADTFFELDDSHRGNSPYLRSIIENRGTWGVSHTRMPTESRPGHVALIAGLYEDPSAVAKGWKENPVEFDSVFNESRYTWSWGSPDILPMFAKGASGNHVYIDTYGAEVEDFSGKSSTVKLDTWVFRKVEDFLNSTKTNNSLNEKLHEDKIVFFLHLLGLDTAGHTHKPHSEEYKHNLRVVDSEIEKVEQLFEEFYDHDKRTAYVFTADHGMTDWGSHGAGDKSETETPLVAWGPGIQGPRPGRHSDPKSPHNWELSHKARHDVNQADIAPLMSSLIGVPVPVNSVGILPRNYLNVTEFEMSEFMFANALQMAAQFSKKREITEAGTLPSLYKEFPSLTQRKQAEYVKEIQKCIIAGRYNESILKSEELISLSLLGLEYYQNYYQCLLLTCITLAILGWIGWLLQSLVAGDKITLHCGQNVTDKRHSGFFTKRIFNGAYLINMIFSILVILSVMLIFVQMLPLQFYIYVLLPQLIWWAVMRQYATFRTTISYVRNSLGLQKFFLLVLFYILGIEILVVSFFHRFFLSIGMLGLAAWPIASPLHKPVKKILLTGWIISCLLLALFPLLPVVGKEPNTNLVAVSGGTFLILALYCAWKLKIHKIVNNDKPQEHYIVLVQLLALAVAIWDLLSTAESVKEKKGLLWINQVVSWLLLAVSLCLPILGSQRILLRLYSVGLSLIVPFLLLSASHEVLFILAFMLNMFCWLCLELNCEDAASNEMLELEFNTTSVRTLGERALSSKDFRRAYFFLFYIFVSFFGTGNIASINSFDPTWVRCFLTVFSPFIMTLLILWKIMIPFLGVTCTFRAVNIIVQAPTGKLFLIVLAFSDAMGLHFLHLVTNQGSWLDIGTSISHYVIVQTTVVFLVLLYGFARFLTDFSFNSFVENRNSAPSLESGDFTFSDPNIITGIQFDTERKHHFE